MLSFSLAALAAVSALTCPMGLHRSADGKDQAVITVRPNGAYRYTFIDGRRGDVGASGSPLSCSDGKLIGGDGAWEPVEVRTTQTSLDSHGTKLAATLVEPSGPGPHPLVVFVHGS